MFLERGKLFRGSIEEDKSQNKETKILNELKDLERPLKSLLTKLKPKIDSGHYDLFIGDDRSGRIPALIVKKVVDNRYKQLGHDQADLRFIAGGKNLPEELRDRKVNEIADNFKSHGYKNVLIITEHINTGEGMMMTIEGLKKAGLNVEIASVTISGEDEMYHNINEPIIDGELGLPPKVYNKSNLSGVYKENSETFAKVYKGENDVASARESAKLMAEDLSDWYDSQDNLKTLRKAA